MSSLAQIHANQANAQLSTGPTSPEGKARSAGNARKHGFTAKTVNITDSDRAEFEALTADLRRESRPSGRLEEELFQRILTHTWNLSRIEAFESQILAQTNPMAEPGPESANLERFARYRRDLERSLYRAIAELRKLQTERATLLRQPEAVAQAVLKTTPLAEVTKLTKRSEILSSPMAAPKPDVPAMEPARLLINGIPAQLIMR